MDQVCRTYIVWGMSIVAETMAKTRRQQQDYTRFDSRAGWTHRFALYLYPFCLYICIYIYMFVSIWRHSVHISFFGCRPRVGPTSERRRRRRVGHMSAPRHVYHTPCLSSALCRPPVGEKLVSAILLSCSNRLRFSGSTKWGSTWRLTDEVTWHRVDQPTRWLPASWWRQIDQSIDCIHRSGRVGCSIWLRSLRSHAEKKASLFGKRR